MAKSSTAANHLAPYACEGTLVWVGPTQGTTVEQAFEYCVERAAQVAIRKSLDHWLQFPAEGVRWLVVVRPSRNPAPPALVKAMEQIPAVRSGCLLGPECEGELRSGSPWPHFENIAWHRWNQVLPDWFQSVGRNRLDPVCHGLPTEAVTKRCLTIGLVASRRQNIDALMDLLASWHHIPLWVPCIKNSTFRNLDGCIWDDSAVSAASATQWSERLQLAQRILKADGIPGRPRERSMQHVWMPSFPRPHEWDHARLGGVGTMISKPFNLRALNDWLNAIEINLAGAAAVTSFA